MRRRPKVSCRECGKPTTAADGVCLECSEVAVYDQRPDTPIEDFYEDDGDDDNRPVHRGIETYHGGSCRDDL